jgi:opacity protein-like surface antigen
MLNVLFDIPNSSPFTPYIGVGGGWTWDKYNVACTDVGDSPYCAASADGERSFSTNGPSAQIMVGVNHQLSDQVTLGVEGRYFADFASGKTNTFDGGDNQIDFDPEYQVLDLLLRLQIDLQ